MAKGTHYLDLESSGLSYEERLGQLDAISAAIGQIAINFSDLEKEISSAVTYLLGSNREVGKIVTAELSFKGKLNLMSSLFLNCSPEAAAAEMFHDLLKLCNRAEELRNQILHSSWLSTPVKGNVRRMKYTAKMKNGLKDQDQEMSSGDLMDIADYISYAVSMVDEFFSWQFEDYDSWTWAEVSY